MGKYAVIGLGSFGYYVAIELTNRGNEVIAVDHDRKKVDHIKDEVTQAIVSDCTEEENLLALGLKEMDGVIVGLGPDLENSILAVYLLSKMEVPRIIAKALSENHAKILALTGATEVLYPERDIAQKVALTLSSPNVLDYIPLAEDYSIREIEPPKIFHGKTLLELNLTNRYGIFVVGIKNNKNNTTIFPNADFVIDTVSTLIVIGSEKNLDRVSLQV